MISAKGEG